MKLTKAVLVSLWYQLVINASLFHWVSTLNRVCHWAAALTCYSEADHEISTIK